jgi:hypothetical protein
MKTTILYQFACLLVSVVLLSACGDHKDVPATGPVLFIATLSGDQERPAPVNSPGSGLLLGSLDRTTRVLSYTVTYQGINPIAGHLHRVTPNSTVGNGPVEIGFGSLGSPIIGMATLTTQSRVDSLIGGAYYVNLHTTAFPGGEIRGNIRVRAAGPIALNATINGGQERPTPVSSAGTGLMQGLIDPATRVLSYTVAYTGINPVAGHLHRITPNSTVGNGPVEIGFGSLGSPIIGMATLTTQSRVDSLLSGLYYVNLHTTAFPAGEIRGNIKTN